MIYHLCYVCSQPDAVIAALEAVGLDTILVSPPTPAVLFGGREVSFHIVSGFGLIELLHAPEADIRQHSNLGSGPIKVLALR